jgi:hypothetical protein
MSFAEPIWASGHCTASIGRTHDRIRTDTDFCALGLEPIGPCTHRKILDGRLKPTADLPLAA